MAKAKTLDCPPFPHLTWDDFFWTAECRLPSWAGFDTRSGGPVADGTARLSVTAADTDARTPPSAEQIASFRYLLDNEAAVADAVARAVVKYCPGHAYDGDDETFWAVSRPSDLRPLIRLVGVHVSNVARDGSACVGFEFDSTWDDEHGTGVMTHSGRVIATGQGACSFEAWIARDGLTRRVG